jgi:hypothetical protein
MASWGWLALLAIPGRLLWITGAGYLAPAAWAPFRWVRFGSDAWIGEYWAGGLVAATLFAVAAGPSRPLAVEVPRPGDRRPTVTEPSAGRG